MCCNAVALDDGVLDLNTWQLRPHTPSLFVTTRLRASYQKGLSTDCPVFKKFLADITCGDSVLTQRIWQALGFLLAPDQSEKYFILFQGVSNSGKSVLGNFVRNCFIGDVTTSLELNELSGRFTLSELVGKKFCSDLDLPAEPLKNRAVSNLKKMTGHDQITSDVKFSDRAKFTCTAKFLFGTNHAILLKKKDPAFLNRLVVIPFFRSFNGKEQDRTLLNRLEWERDAVVMKALTAYREFARNGSCFAGDYQVNQVIGCNAHSSAEDAVADFLGFKCMKAEGAWTSTEALYNAFTQTYGILCEKARFSELLLQTAEAMGVTVEKGRGRPVPGANPVWGFTGIILK